MSHEMPNAVMDLYTSRSGKLTQSAKSYADRLLANLNDQLKTCGVSNIEEFNAQSQTRGFSEGEFGAVADLLSRLTRVLETGEKHVELARLALTRAVPIKDGSVDKAVGVLADGSIVADIEYMGGTIAGLIDPVTGTISSVFDTDNGSGRGVLGVMPDDRVVIWFRERYRSGASPLTYVALWNPVTGADEVVWEAQDTDSMIIEQTIYHSASNTVIRYEPKASVARVYHANTGMNQDFRMDGHFSWVYGMAKDGSIIGKNKRYIVRCDPRDYNGLITIAHTMDSGSSLVPVAMLPDDSVMYAGSEGKVHRWDPSDDSERIMHTFGRADNDHVLPVITHPDDPDHVVLMDGASQPRFEVVNIHDGSRVHAVEYEAAEVGKKSIVSTPSGVTIAEGKTLYIFEES